MIGRRLAHFEITAKLGEGGMGEVYRATDTSLGREVALKVLPQALAGDEERLARFEREAKVLASVSHPGIAGIFSLERADGVRFLTMELVPGEALDARLARGPLPVGDAVEIARQMAVALEAAHEQGIVHRDLKPANVMVTPEGEVKILDFGLAKAVEPASADASPILTQSPTITHQMTRVGTFLGTAAYMSPEQARGQEADKRSDVWSFGVVLYEMLTGESSFGGDTISDTLAAVLTAEPDLDELPAAAPPALRTLVARCLEKDPRQRLRDIGEARILLSALVAGEPVEPGVDSSPAAAGRTRRWLLPAALAAAAAVGALLGGWLVAGRTAPPAAAARIRFDVAHPEPEAGFLSAPVLAPDGSWLVYSAADPDAARLYSRRLAEAEPRPVPGTEGAYAPFISPDSRWLGFFAGGEIQKVPIDGGSPSGVHPVGASPGAHWGGDGYIYFSTWVSGLSRIAASGAGTAEAVTELEADELGHWWPQLLPGGRGLLFTVWDRGTGSLNNARIVHLDLESGAQTSLAEGAAATYLPSGHLVYQRAGVWVAAAFDPGRVELADRVRTVLDDVPPLDPTGQSNGYFSFAANGTLAHISRQDSPFHLPQRLIWIDRSGAVGRLPFAAAQYAEGRLSADGSSLAVARKDHGKWDVWLLDLERSTERRVTDRANNGAPTPHPDGRTIAFQTIREGSLDIFETTIAGDGEPRPLVVLPEDASPEDWSPDGRLLLYGIEREATHGDLMLFDLEAGESRPAVVEPGSQDDGRFSPDGRWLAYVSDRSGAREALVRPFPGPGPVVQVSTGGGFLAGWAGSEPKLYFWRGPRLFELDYAVEGDRFVPGRERPFFPEEVHAALPPRSDLAVSPDGRRVLAVTREPEPRLRVRVVVGGLEEMVAGLASATSR